jgi:biotin operon repressor
MAPSKRDKLVFPNLCRYKNEIDYVDKLITIYSTIAMGRGEQLRKFEKEVLNYYMRFGYNSGTKKRITEDLGKSSETITQATFYLKKKGYLVDSRTNMSKKKLSKGLQEIKDNFIDGDKKILAIGFKRK